MATLPKAPVQAPRRFPPSLTLIGASRTLLGDQDLDGNVPRWEGGGVEFASLPCRPGFEPFPADCEQKDLSELLSPEIGDADSIILWTGERCSSASATEADLDRQVRDLLDVDRHRQLERHFWDTFLAVEDGPTNLSPDPASSPLAYALAALQEALASGTVAAPGGCGRGMIHSTVTVASLWFGANLLRREGGLLLDVFDNVIVPGVGYTGSSPTDPPEVDATGETSWAYATGPVDTRLGQVRVNTHVDPNDNDVIAIAQQGAIAYADPCCRYGINVNVCDTACGGA
jgi:hypothetical protein